MDYRKHLVYIIIGAVMLLNGSCLSIHYKEGKTILGATTDTALNGSSIITGHVYHIDFLPAYPYTLLPDEIWLENAQYRTTVDSLGNYTLRISPGTYTMKCQGKGNQWVQLVEEKQDIILSANKKVQLDFYIGYRIE